MGLFAKTLRLSCAERDMAYPYLPTKGTIVPADFRPRKDLVYGTSISHRTQHSSTLVAHLARDVGRFSGAEYDLLTLKPPA